MKDILVLGAGKIGALVSGLLAESGDYRVQLVDSRAGAAADVANAHGLDNIVPFDLDAADKKRLAAHVAEHKPIAVVHGKEVLSVPLTLHPHPVAVHWTPFLERRPTDVLW